MAGCYCEGSTDWSNELVLAVLGVRKGIREAEKAKAQSDDALLPEKELQREKQP